MTFFSLESTRHRSRAWLLVAIMLACAGIASQKSAASQEGIANQESDVSEEDSASEEKEYVSPLTRAERRALGAEFYRRLSPYFLNTNTSPFDASGEGFLESPETISTGRVSGIPDGQILLMDLRLDKFFLPEPMALEKNGSGFLIRLEDLIRALDFPIEVDEAAGRAEGWFIRESNRFSLDIENRSVLVGDRSIVIGPRMIERRGEEIWISNNVASDWFSIEFVINYRQLMITLKPSEPLPVQEKLRRANMRVAGRPRHVLPTRNPYVPAPRPMIGTPSFDTQLINSLSGAKGRKLKAESGYAVNAKAPLLGGALSAYINGDESDAVRAARFSLGFKEPEGILGVSALTQVTVGDVYSVRTSLLGSGRLERGLYISNLPLGRQINLDTATIAGDSFPGYDVQLFRGSALIGSKVIGDDGRYEFDEVPVFPGVNEFRLVFFSPQGQVIEETEIVNVDPARFSSSRLVYELSMTDQNKSLLDDTTSTIGLERGLRAAGRAQYTLGGGIALEAGFESLIDLGQRRTLGYAGISRSSRIFRARAVVTAELNGNFGAEALIQAQLGKLRARLEHRELGDIGLGAEALATRRFSSANLNATLRMGGTRSPRITYDIFAKREEFVGGEMIKDFGLGLGTRVAGLGLSANVAYRESTVGSKKESLIGASQLTFRSGRWQTRLQGAFELSPVKRLTNLNANIGYLITKSLRPELKIQHQTANNLTSATAFLNYDAGFARISPSISYDTDNRFAAFVTARFSTTREPPDGEMAFP